MVYIQYIHSSWNSFVFCKREVDISRPPGRSFSGTVQRLTTRVSHIFIAILFAILLLCLQFYAETIYV